ncbi:hypothetical protein V8C35DRAFT_141013 [Trichoderma chlorosporum]
MRITLNVFNPHGGDQDSLVTLEVFPDMTVSTLRESVQSEAGIPPTSQHIYHNGRLISDDAKTMEQLQIGDGDMLAFANSQALPRLELKTTRRCFACRFWATPPSDSSYPGSTQSSPQPSKTLRSFEGYS